MVFLSGELGRLLGSLSIFRYFSAIFGSWWLVCEVVLMYSNTVCLGVTIQHSVDVVRLLIFPYMKYKSHLTFFFQVKKSVNSRI